MMTMNRNPESPWNPVEPASITPEEYEKQVFNWLQAVGHKLENFEVTHRKNLPGSGGNYEFDVVVKFTVLCGAQLILLVECKRHSRPIKRENINAFICKNAGYTSK